MTLRIESQGVPHALFDIGGLTWGREGNCITGLAGASLAPTAIANANWALESASQIYLYSILFGTDTALTLTLYHRVTDPGYATVTKQSGNFAGGLNGTFEAQVVASAPVNVIYPIQLPAGFFGEILAPAWLTYGGGDAIVLSTPTVAANCTAAFRWAQM